jgi:integrase
MEQRTRTTAEDTEEEEVTKSRARGTGGIFKPKGSRFWWINYVSGGRRRYESTKSTRKQDAQALLTSRLGDVSHGIAVTPKMGRITLADALKAVINDLTMNGRKGVAHTQRQIDKHILLQPPKGDALPVGYFYPDRRLNTITTTDLTAYTAHRMGQGASAASCNHELATLRRAFRLALRANEIATMPYIPMLKVDNIRKGFFEQAQFDAILKHLPAHLHPPLKFMYTTGWRVSEVFSLTTAQVDLVANVVRLEVGTTKNKAGRVFYLTPDLRELLQQQFDAIKALQEVGTITPFVFHYEDGRQIHDFRAAWKTGRESAGHPNALLHDFRRTAVRNLERAGVPRSTAMAMVGHKTESIYRRYAIVDEAMHREAAERLAAWTTEQKAKAEKERKGQVARFKRRRAS